MTSQIKISHRQDEVCAEDFMADVDSGALVVSALGECRAKGPPLSVIYGPGKSSEDER